MENKCKKCSKCGEIKAVTEFYKRNDRKNGCVSKCVSCYQKYQMEKYRINKIYYKIYYLRNRISILEDRKEYYKNNKQNINNYNKDYSRKNISKINNKTSKYRCYKLNATPSWADFKAIEKIYEDAAFYTRVSGESYHVDHIDPLQSPLICGLHVENNLRIVEASYNLCKNNSFTPYRIDKNGKKYLIKVSDSWKKRCENFTNRIKPVPRKN